MQREAEPISLPQFDQAETMVRIGKRVRRTPEGDALVREILANERFVAEAVEAQRRIDAGEATFVRWEDVKRELDSR